MSTFCIFTNFWFYYLMIASFTGGMLFFVTATEKGNLRFVDGIVILISALGWPIALLYFLLLDKYIHR